MPLGGPEDRLVEQTSKEAADKATKLVDEQTRKETGDQANRLEDNLLIFFGDKSQQARIISF
jgi:hypothetical protein